jgi:hypothetical protein
MMHRKWFAVAAAAANVQSFWISPFINLDTLVPRFAEFKTTELVQNMKNIESTYD